MSHVAESSAGRRQMSSKLVGEETGLSMVICLICKRARVCEARSKKENENVGRVYVKCLWCGYYRCQRGYLHDLVEAKMVQVFVDEEEIQQVQSMEQIHAAGSPAAGGGKLKSNELEAKVEKLTQAMMFLGLLVVAFFAMGLGYALK